MLVRKTLKVTEPLSIWSVTLPAGASKGRILGVWDADGNTLSVDSDGVVNNKIEINFGLDENIGELDYEFEDGKEPTLDAHISSPNNGITIINTNNNTWGTQPSPQL